MTYSQINPTKVGGFKTMENKELKGQLTIGDFSGGVR